MFANKLTGQLKGQLRSIAAHYLGVNFRFRDVAQQKLNMPNGGNKKTKAIKQTITSKIVREKPVIGPH